MLARRWERVLGTPGPSQRRFTGACGSVDLRPGQHLGPFGDFRHFVLPFNGHQVNPGNAFHLFEFLDLLNGEFDAFLGLLALAGTLQPLDQFVGEITRAIRPSAAPRRSRAARRIRFSKLEA